MKGFLIDSSQAEPSFDEWLQEQHCTTVYKLREVARMTASKKDYSIWISSLYNDYREEMAYRRALVEDNPFLQEKEENENGFNDV
ncbi:MAG: hypothetical protein K2O32_15225 [Acetatifactor sp.]|nr:hypothetical protein [Acetatifactor sp.]